VPSPRLQLAIRPEHVLLRTGQAGGDNVLRGRIVQRDFLGTRFEYMVAVGDAVLRATSPQELELGDILAELPAGQCMSFWDNDKQAATN
jgi:iron(III) transport system ATP-binding protein